MALSRDPYFKLGEEVEVHSTQGCVFTPATIIAKSSSGTSFTVEYKTLKPKTSVEKPFREEIDISLLRPSPPKESDCVFELGQEVDAYRNGRWWEGVINKVLEGSSKYSVLLQIKREIEFEPSRLRPHREWVLGKWVPLLQEKVRIFMVFFLVLYYSGDSQKFFL